MEHRAASKSRISATSRASRAATFRSARPTPIHDLRGEMVYEMRKIGHRRRSASPRGRDGRPERDRHAVPAAASRWPISSCAVAYICKNVARRHGKTVTFMPKPIFEDNGSGMHTHTSLWKGGKPLFAGNGYAGLSEIGPARRRRTAQTCAGDSGVRRADHEFVSPSGAGLRSAGESRRSRRATARRRSASRCTRRARRPSGWSSAVPIRAATATWRGRRCSMAMLDGIQNKLDPGKPLDRDIYRDDARRDGGAGHPHDARLARRKRSTRSRQDQRVPAHRRRVHRRFDSRHGSAYKRENELDPIRLRPHPHEFYLYYDN